MRMLLRLFPVSVLAFFVVVLGNAAWIDHRWQQSMVPPPPSSAAVGVVFFGGLHNGQLNDSTLKRLDTARHLFRRGQIQQILCIGGLRPSWSVTGAQLMCQHLQQHGISSDKTQLGTGSFDTLSNLQELQRWLHGQPHQQLVLISSPLHLARIEDWLSQMTPPTGHTTQPRQDQYTFAASEQALSLPLHQLLQQTASEWLSYLLHGLLPTELYQHWLKQWRFGNAPMLPA